MVAPFDAEQRAALQAAIEEIIPSEHDYHGGWRDGVESYLDYEWHGVLEWAHDLVKSAVAVLIGNPSLRALDQAQRDAPIRISHEGFYAAPHLKEPPGWSVVGFNPIPEGVKAIEPEPLPTIALPAADESYDTIVVGAGTGGGVAASMLADAGERVLLVERSRQHTSAELRNDHLRGKRAAIYTPTAGPSHHELRVQETADGGVSTVEPHEIGWGLAGLSVLGEGQKGLNGRTSRDRLGPQRHDSRRRHPALASTSMAFLARRLPDGIGLRRARGIKPHRLADRL